MRAARYNRAARVTRIRYDNNVRPRALLLKAIDHMLTTLMVLVSSIPHIALLDEGSDGSTFYFLQCSAWMTCVTIAIQILNVLTSSYFQRRMLGADSSGGMLPGARYRQRGPPPTVSDWRGRQCQKKTRFKQCQIRTMLQVFEFVDDTGGPKRFKVYQSGKAYQKRNRDGFARGSPSHKFFYVTGETALLVLLVNLSNPCRYCDMQESLNGIPSSEISLIIAFMFEYLDCTRQSAGFRRSTRLQPRIRLSQRPVWRLQNHAGGRHRRLPDRTLLATAGR